MINLKKTLSLALSTKICLCALFLSTLFLRLWFVNDHQFIFYYDQARDALTARQIAAGDWKIFGPTASGTKDTIFHGVLYYYFLAPFYAHSADPQIAVFALAIFSSLAIFPVFFLARAIFRQEKIALIPTFFLAFSALNIIDGTWLSNPALATVFLPLFFYFAWRSFNHYCPFNLIMTAIFLGLSVQSAIFLAFWLIFVFIGLFHLYFHAHLTGSRFWRPLFCAILVFCLTVSSMIIVEILMIQRGILSPESITNFTFSSGQVNEPTIARFQQVAFLVVQRLGLALWPFITSLVIAIFISGFIAICRHRTYLSYLSAKAFNFLIAACATPIVFLLLFYRSSLHIFIGLDFIVYFLFTLVLLFFAKKLFSNSRQQRLFIIIILILFAICNGLHLILRRQQSDSHILIQQGSNLADQLNLIDATYQSAHGQPFSISTDTNPYGVNIVWSYLYSWYGQQHYGYQPSFFGPPQTGLISENILKETDDCTQQIHFTIYEPNTGLPTVTANQWRFDQTALCGTPSASLNFGTLELEMH